MRLFQNKYLSLSYFSTKIEMPVVVRDIFCEILVLTHKKMSSDYQIFGLFFCNIQFIIFKKNIKFLLQIFVRNNAIYTLEGFPIHLVTYFLTYTDRTIIPLKG